MQRDEILAEFRKSPDYAGLEEYARLSGDSGPLDALHEEYLELVEDLSRFQDLSESKKEATLERATDKMFEPVGQLDGHATATVWLQLAELDEATCRAVTDAVLERFSDGLHLGPWSSVVFVFDEFAESIVASFDAFSERPDFHQRFRERARAMARFVAFPWHPTATTREEFASLLDLGQVRDQVRRVVEYGARHIGLNHARVDAALVFLLAISGEPEDERLLRKLWEVVQTRHLEPKFPAERFERLIAAAENFPKLRQDVRDVLEARFTQLDSVALLTKLSGEKPSYEQVRDARLQVTVSSTPKAADGQNASSRYQMTLLIRPGYSELVARDREADWLIRLSALSEGTSQTYTHRGLDERGSHDLGVELNVSRPHDFPTALAEASRQLDVEWDLSLKGLAKGNFSQAKVSIEIDAVLEWLRGGV